MSRTTCRLAQIGLLLALVGALGCPEGGPVLWVSRSAISFGPEETEEFFQIQNSGAGVLTWQVEADVDWLSLTQRIEDTDVAITEGTTTDEIDVIDISVDRDGLAVGMHSGAIVITSNDGTIEVLVSVEVTSPATLRVSPRTLDLETTGTSATFTITNDGSEGLDWSLAWPGDAGWLIASPTSDTLSTGRQLVEVEVDRTGWTATTYESDITISSDVGTETVHVVMTVLERLLIVEPSSLDFGADATQLTLTLRNHGDATINWTTAKDVAWITQVTPSGTTPAGETSDIVVAADRGGLEPADYEGTLTITSGAQIETVHVSLTVPPPPPPPPPPELIVAPRSLDFRTDHVDKVVALWNGGIGTVNWRIDTAALPDWLSLSSAGGEGGEGAILQGALTGEETDSLRVSVDRSGLAPTTETGAIVVTATDRDGNPLESRTITVSMSVAAHPVLGVDTGTLAFGEDATEATLTLANLGTGTLTWTIDPTDFPAWLSITPGPLEGVLETNEDFETLTVAVDRTGLDSGDYEHVVEIQGNENAAGVSVTMTVPRPVLTLTPTRVNMGATDTNASVVLSNTGGGLLEWAIQISEEYPWLDVDPKSIPPGADSPQTITVTVDRSGVAHGDYEGYADISWNDGNLTRLEVRMTVPGPVLSVTPLEVTFGPTETEQTVTVENVGDASRVLTWNISELPLPWTSVDLRVGTTTDESDPIVVTVNRSRLAQGTYEGNLTFTSNDGEQTVPVTMEVGAFSVQPSELVLESLDDSATFRIENHSPAPLAWTATETVDWLEVEPAAGAMAVGGHATVTATVSRAGLATQWYEDIITLTAPDMDYGQALPVRMRVAAFELDPDLLELGEINEPVSGTFEVRNIGDEVVTSIAIVSDGAVWLSVDVEGDPQTTNPGEASTVTVTADPTGMNPGDYEGTITVSQDNDSDTVTITMTVPAPPQLSASPSTLNFGTVASDKLVAIWNSGVGTVHWAINDAGFPPWLSVSRTGGSVPDGETETHAVVVSVDRRGITPPSSETHEIAITATDQDGNELTPCTLRVSMAVAAVPILTVEANPPAWDANAKPILTLGEEGTTAEFTIANTGTGTLNWQIDPSEFPAWLSISEPLQGSLTPTTEAARRSCVIERTGLASGDHSHEVTVSSNGGTAVIRIVMTVPRPILSFTPEALDFGEDGTAATVTISNTGGDILDWSIRISEETGWLMATHEETDATSGLTLIGVEEVIDVTVDRQGLQSGDYEAELFIDSNGGNKSLPVTMTVPGPRLAVTPSELLFSALETEKTLTVQNAGDTAHTLIWWIEEGYPHWLNFDRNRDATTQEPNVIEVTADRAGLSAGTHAGRISFDSNGGTATVDVEIDVPLFTLAPTEIEIGNLENSATFLIENHADASIEWTASVDWTQWTTPDVTDWFEVRPFSGAIPINARATLLVDVLNRDGLPTGWEEGPVVITETATGNEQALTVRVRVATFTVVEPRLLDFGTVDTVVTDTFVIRNNNGAPLVWTATVTPDTPWLSLDNSSGEVVETETITVTVDPTALGPGSYQGTVTIEGGEDVDAVVVQITVPTPPTLAAAPLLMDFGTVAGERILAIWNAGIGVVAWRIDTNDFPDWLTLTPVVAGIAEGTVTGAQTDTVMVTVSRTGLDPSEVPYTYDDFEITATDGAGTPLESLPVQVTMTVAGVPIIDVDTGAVDQLGVPFINLGTALSEATFSIRNTGSGVLFWSINTSDLPSWITSMAPSQGSIAPGEQTIVTVRVDRTGLEFGGEDYTFRVVSNDFQSPVVDVSLTLQIPKQVVIGIRTGVVDLGQDDNSSFFEVANTGDPGSILDFVVECNKEWLYFFPATGQSVGTSTDIKDWRSISISVDRSKLEGTGSTARIDVHAFELDENLNPVLLDEVVSPRSIDVTVMAAPLSFEVAAAATRVPSQVRLPMLMRNIHYRALPLPPDQLDIYNESFTVYEKDVPLEITETTQFLTDGSRLRTDVVILLDYSGSMFDAAQLIEDDPAFDEYLDNHPDLPLDPLQAIYEFYIGALIWQLPDYYRIAILEFHERGVPVVSRPNVVYNFTKNKTVLIQQLQSISIQDHGASEVLTELMSTSSYLANADSPYIPVNSPEMAAYYLPFDSADVSALIFVSDGRITTPPAKVKDALDWLAGDRTRLFAIGWGKDVNHEPLARIASGTGGHYYPTSMVMKTDSQGEPIYDGHGNPILLPTTEELGQYCFTTAPCEQSIARDLQSQVAFSYVSLNEEAGVATRVAATFDDPNDDEGACGLQDQGAIFGSFTQKVDFDLVVGDVNLGQVSMHTDGIQPDDTAELILRADYIPRNIHELEITLSSTQPFTISCVSGENGGIVWDWTPAPEDPVDVGGGLFETTFPISSPDGEPLRYGEFGDLFLLDFAGVTNAFTVNLFVDDDLYIDPDRPYEDKYFIYPNAIEVNEDGRRAPAFPAPLITRIDPVHDDDVVNTFHLGSGEDHVEFTIANIGGTFPYLPEEPVVVLDWEVDVLPVFLEVPLGMPSAGILRDGVGDADTVIINVDRDITAGEYYATIPIKYWHLYGSGVAGINVWLSVLMPLLDVTDEAGDTIGQLDFGEEETEDGFWVVNTGQGTLFWRLAVYDEFGVEVEAEDLPDWLDISSLGGTVAWSDPDPPFNVEENPPTVQVELDRVTAPEGDFTYTLGVTGEDERSESVAPPSYLEVEVSGTILPPELFLGQAPPFSDVPLDPAELDFGDAAGGCTSMAFFVSNSGQRVLYWHISGVGGLPDWLAVSGEQPDWLPPGALVGGTIPYNANGTMVTATVNRSEAPATFSHTLTLAGEDAEGQIVEPGIDITISGTN